jgi:1-aminocyclopropane-1-carboxylate deaminase/D-cysteine desulfhydrase-like pyridoxal-dependent ACC family enzyme
VTIALAVEGIARLGRRQLAILPSPLSPAPELAASLGLPALWIKRDELVGFGFGGNKVRGLELIVADALAAGADVLVTGAGPQSNHVRATAAAAAHAGLDLVAVYSGAEPPRATGNLALTRLLGATPQFTGDPDRASVDRAILDTAARLRAEGRRPYPIPRGGACALGVLAHVLAAFELDAQCRAAGIAPELVALAVGSGGTLAGWLLGTRLAGARWRVEGVTVSRPVDEARRRVGELAREATALAGLSAAIAADEVVIHDGYLGEGYGIPSAAGNDAIRTVARHSGVFLDPTYTGKAFAGLIGLARAGRITGPVVFLHTGGEPALFSGVAL